MRGSHKGGNRTVGGCYYEGVDATLLREPAPEAESPMVAPRT